MIPALTLTPADAGTARVVALARRGNNLVLGRRPAYGADVAGGGLDLDLDGARAELAFCRMLGADPAADWSGYNGGQLDNDGDVAGWHVRSTRYRDGHLIIHPRDDAAARFALVVTNGVIYRAAGWILAGDARRPEWWRQLNPGHAAAWCVPQAALRPFGGAGLCRFGRGFLSASVARGLAGSSAYSRRAYSSTWRRGKRPPPGPSPAHNRITRAGRAAIQGSIGRLWSTMTFGNVSRSIAHTERTAHNEHKTARNPRRRPRRVRGRRNDRVWLGR